MSEDYGDACPVGHYCEVGTHTPEPCPAGTFSNSTGLRQESECTRCTSGKCCEIINNTPSRSNGHHRVIKLFSFIVQHILCLYH